MKAVLRNLNKFGTLNAQYLLNKSRNAVRFESQNIIWDYEESNFQALAFSKGLTSLAFQKGSEQYIQAIISSSEYLLPNRQRPTLPSSALPASEPI
jgi:hypothetical protein